MEKTSETSEDDWLLTEYRGRETKDASILALYTIIHLAKECCNPPLSLEETKELLEIVWYEMDQEEDSEFIPM